MKNLILRVLMFTRNAFRRIGIQPPYWAIQLGRKIFDKYSRLDQLETGAFSGRNPSSLSVLEAKVDRILWTIERIEATLYIQSLQTATPPAPVFTNQETSSSAMIDTSHQA